MPAGINKRRICLVTPGHLSTNPRLVKEADALVSAGYEVSIVSSRFIEWADEADREFENRSWRVVKVSFGPIAGRFSHIFQSFRRRAALYLYEITGMMPEMAFHPVVPTLTHAASAIPADIYIAHNLAALPAAYRAARKNGAMLGFDAEDFHSGELPNTPANAFTIKLTREIESRYLPSCDYLTAASPGIARAYVEAYGVKEPQVILNVFPISEAPEGVTDRGNTATSHSLYWFSQTIGQDRGLETVIVAISLSSSRPMFYLRGHDARGCRDGLIALAKQHGVEDLLFFLPTTGPGDMIKLASRHDVGVASETEASLNRKLALSNKIFTYILAGVPVLASATLAQSEISQEMPGAVFLYPMQNAQALANRIDELLLSPDALANARLASWKLGQERFNWDIEQKALLQIVDATLSQSVKNRNQEHQ